jgi:hypothetical protein
MPHDGAMRTIERHVTSGDLTAKAADRVDCVVPIPGACRSAT